MEKDNQAVHHSSKEHAPKKTEVFLKTDGGKTASNAIQIPSISLPTGGGAIKGIDEKFSVNAVNGTAAFSIPLPFSQARGNSPSLNLTYNSGNGNGIFGLGWGVNLPSIKRKTDKGLPQYMDAIDSDIFLISEADDLVPEFKRETNGSFSLNSKGEYIIYEKDSPDNLFLIRFFRPRIEGAFSRIEKWSSKNSPDVKWRVISKDNVTTLFGWSSNSRIFNPVDAEKIYEWLPEFSFDDKGNCTHYIYKKENETGFDHTLLHNRNRVVNGTITYTNIYLEKILYGNKTPYKNFADAFPNESGYLFSAIFDYGEYNKNAPYQEINDWSFRTDAFSHYKAGFEIRTTRLCKRVLFFHHFTGPGEYEGLVKSVNFEYDSSSLQSFTFLKSITFFGYIHRGGGDYTHKNLPPLEFEYQKHEWNKEVKFISPGNLVHAPSGLDEQHYQFTDLFNEGLSGILTEQANGWYYKHNLGDGKFEQAKLVTPKPSFAGLGSKFHLADLNADGGKQLVSFNTEPKGYFELNDDNEWPGFKYFQSLPTINFSDPNTKMLDLDGDGKPDLLVSEEAVFTWYPSEGKDGFSRSHKSIKSFDEEAGPHIVFAEEKQTIFMADMSGNGLTDIVRIRNGEVCYWPNLGFGKFGAKVAMDQSPVFDHPDSFNPAFIRLADIDGSGTTDIIYLGKNKFCCWMNLCGNSFSATAFEIEAFPEIHNQAKISVADILGNGVACIVWSSSLSKDVNAPLKYIDLVGGKKPHLLVDYKNNLGTEVSLEYTPSTKFYIEDKLAGKPWITKLHFPVHCISKTITCDKISGSRFTHQYKYHHGHYDHPEKEFRGFGMVEQIDSEDFEHFVKDNASHVVEQDLHQEPVISKTWFHTGAFLNREKILSQFAHEYWYEEIARKGFTVTHYEMPLPDARITGAKGIDATMLDHLSAQEWREAIRACKGVNLRSEVFAKDAVKNGNTDDAIKKELTPYTVSTRNCFIELIQPKGKNKYAVYAVKESESVTYTYERDPEDPRIAHKLNIKLDTYGNVLESASVVYPRLAADGSLPEITQQEQGVTFIAYKENKFTNDIADDLAYPHILRLPLPSEEITYELKGVSKTGIFYSPADFEDILSNAKSSDAEYHEQDKPLAPGKAQKRIVEHTRSIYYKNDLTGPLPLHHLDSLAFSFENYQLAYTPALLADIFSAKVPLPADREALMTEGKFVHSEMDANWWIPSGSTQFIEGAETKLNAQNRFYVPVSFTDAYGAKTKTKYDGYSLFIKETEDQLGNTSRVTRFNFRTCVTQRASDINGNFSESLEDELGLVKAMAKFGKGSEADDLTGINEFTDPAETNLIQQLFTVPDTPQGVTDSAALTAIAKQLLQHATIRFVYDLDVYKNAGKPAVVASILREEYYQVNNNSPIQLSFHYSNGHGAEVMKKSQAEPGAAKKVIVQNNGNYSLTNIDTASLLPEQLRWIGSGKIIVNNKGNAVKQYEPYFSASNKYENFKELVETGVTPLLYYDAIGRLVKTVRPDDTFIEVEFDSWMQKTSDANDTVLRSAWYTDRTNHLIDAKLLAEGKDPVKEKEAADKAAKHANTPHVMHYDTLGRPVLSVGHNKNMVSNADEFLRTKLKIDIEGNLLSVTDARELPANSNKGNAVMLYKYDMLGHPAYHNSMDAGQRWELHTVLGNQLRSWDERNYEFRYFYDAAHRPTHNVIIGGESALNNIFDRIIYGESLLLPGRTNEAALQAKNILGKPIQHFDTGGLANTPEYDFEGHALSVTRQLFKKYKEVSNWIDANLVADLETDAFTFVTEIDALGRISKQTAPDASVTTPSYNEAGLLNSETVAHVAPAIISVYIKDIDYNERRDRSKIIYGNDVFTNFYYDEKTFHLKRLETRRKNSDLLQDLYYTFDAVGNITHVEDKAVPGTFFGNTHVEPASEYTYDALYQLAIAKGRENDAALSIDSKDNWKDAPFMHELNPGASVALRKYTQTYDYDKAGNITQMVHAAAGNNWTRDYTYESSNNRISFTRVGLTTYNYAHHPAHGFITELPHLQEMGWNFKEELIKTIQQKRLDGGTPETTYYQYDGEGQRIRKITENEANPGIIPTKKEERIYVHGYERYEKYSGADAGLVRESLSLTDDGNRFVMVETRNDVDDGTEKRLVRYQLHNHLGSAVLELDGSPAANVISYEEYHPFGTTAYQAKSATIKAAAKRYRYTGMERDGETGLEYHSARYYLPWLGRWLSADPILIAGGINVYAYVSNSVIIHSDLAGLQPHPPPTGRQHGTSRPGPRIRSGARAGGKPKPAVKRTPDVKAEAPPDDEKNKRQVTKIDVQYQKANRTGPVKITLHHRDGTTTPMTGMGGGAVDKRGKMHTTDTKHGTTTKDRFEVHTSTKYPSSHPNMNNYTPFSGDEGFHTGPLGVQSHGCIHLRDEDAKKIRENTPAGVKVEIDAVKPPAKPAPKGKNAPAPKKQQTQAPAPGPNHPPKRPQQPTH